MYIPICLDLKISNIFLNVIVEVVNGEIRCYN